MTRVVQVNSPTVKPAMQASHPAAATQV